MIDKKIYLASPVQTRSGYGARGRDLAWALIDAGYDVSIISTAWGTTPKNALDSRNPRHSQILERLIPGQITIKPDIFIHHSIPNEFQQIGNINIGITAGIESTLCRLEWIQGCNKMDLVLVSSNHSKGVFKNVVFDMHDKQTNQKVGEERLHTNVEVLFEGVDPAIYNNNPVDENTEIYKKLSEIKSDFGFLFVGHWLQGNIGHDRKDIGMLVHTFLQTFHKAKNPPALILKTSSAGFSKYSKHQLLDKIDLIKRNANIHNVPIYFLHANLTDEEMNIVYNHPKIKAMVSFTKGEGYGRPLLEFTTTGKPVLASNWSGQMDFLHDEYAFLLPGTLNDVDGSAVNEWIIQGSKWFTVNYQAASQIMNNCYRMYDGFKNISANHIEHTLTNFTMDKMKEKLMEYIDNIDSYTQKKIELPQLKKIILPKLKKTLNEETTV